MQILERVPPRWTNFLSEWMKSQAEHKAWQWGGRAPYLGVFMHRTRCTAASNGLLDPSPQLLHFLWKSLWHLSEDPWNLHKYLGNFVPESTRLGLHKAAEVFSFLYLLIDLMDHWNKNKSGSPKQCCQFLFCQVRTLEPLTKLPSTFTITW